MAVVGFIVKGTDVPNFKESEWVEAIGNIDTTEYDADGDGKAKTVPFIELESIKRIEKGSRLSVIYPF
jgi:uncharacterized membrane protein YcgQ (UPF0703/DUF1980 family)